MQVLDGKFLMRLFFVRLRMSPSDPAPRPELVIGLVGATGTDLEIVTSCLKRSLSVVSYDVEVVHIIELLKTFSRFASLPDSPLEEKIEKRMDAGDELCKVLNCGDALARIAMGRILHLRNERTGDAGTPASGVAYVLRSLKRQEEVELLRSVYGDNFFLVGAFAPRPIRIDSLAMRIAQSHHSASGDDYRDRAERLVQRDLNDHSKRWGQHVGDTFPMADFFVNVTDPSALTDAVDRFVKILFGYQFHTPNKDEYGMFHAHAAALRSGSLGRQVGAAITTADGAIVAVGTNDVPKAGGGQYWEDDQPDKRDHTFPRDASDVVRRGMLAGVLERLVKANWLSEDRKGTPIDTLVQDALSQTEPPILRGTQAMRVIEYGRAIHAEMAAIVDAAFRGVSVAGGILYTTTYPCHNCGRHIIAAGIKRVVYLEPYPKSLTEPLHNDAMVNDIDAPPRVGFHSFMGVAPRKYLQFFEMGIRKRGDGSVVSWDPRSSGPRGSFRSASYLRDELSEFNNFAASLQSYGIVQSDVVQPEEGAGGVNG